MSRTPGTNIDSIGDWLVSDYLTRYQFLVDLSEVEHFEMNMK